MSCVMCGRGESADRLFYCERCLNWWKEWARTHDVPPTDAELPDWTIRR